MKRTLTVLLTLALLIGVLPLAVQAATTPPISIEAPPHFGVTFNYGYFKFYISAPDTIREYLARKHQENPDDDFSGYLTLYYQVDAKINNGSWQYTSEWNSPKTVPDNREYYIPCVDGKYYASEAYAYFHHIFPDETIAKTITDAGWDYFTNNTVTFRARFAQSFDNGNTYVLSPWSKEFVLSANVKLDAESMINHAPTLKGAEIEIHGNSQDLAIKIEKPPQEIGDLNVATGGSVGVEIWLRKERDKDFKNVYHWWVFGESISVDADDYFEEYKDHYDEAAYEIKTRYFLSLKNYRQADSEKTVYSPFSNVISHNMPAWSNASQWATEELKKAYSLGLIPDTLKGADLTKPITRVEFAAMAVKTYENLTGKTTTPAPKNPFTDTKDTEVLKAYNVGITSGTAADKFSPDVLLNREQCATMLTRVLKASYIPGWTLPNDNNFTLNFTQPAKFADDAKISDWAKSSVYFMAANGVISGTGNNNFSPRATTPAEQAVNFASATREQALVIAVRMVENLKDRTLDYQKSAATTQPTASTPIVGLWASGTASGTYNAATGMFENVSGMGLIYSFQADGTYTELFVYGSYMVTKGEYFVEGDMVTSTNRFATQSNDDGLSWSENEDLPEASAYFSTGTDGAGQYLLLGREGATPPLVAPTNAMRFSPLK